MQQVFIIATTSINEEKDITEFAISQEGYDSLEKAQKFCQSRKDVYQIDDFDWENYEPDDFGWFYKYHILSVYVN